MLGRGELCSPAGDRRSPLRINKFDTQKAKINPDRFSRSVGVRSILFDKLEFVNLILFGSKQIPHPFLLHNSPALYKKHSFLHSK